MSERFPIDLGIRISPGGPEVDETRLTALLSYAAEREGRRGEVGLWICFDEEIADLHQRYMGLAGPTDVMSFPGDGSYLGDIAVSSETAETQAVDAGHSTEREIAYLALHGFLHLVGYDDLEPHERERMIARQDELMSAFEREQAGG